MAIIINDHCENKKVFHEAENQSFKYLKSIEYAQNNFILQNSEFEIFENNGSIDIPNNFNDEIYKNEEISNNDLAENNNLPLTENEIENNEKEDDIKIDNRK